VYEYCPEIAHRFLPFLCVDPGREVEEQLGVLEECVDRYPVYGIKIAPVSVQVCILELLTAGERFLGFARERNLPFLVHTTGDPSEAYSQPADVLAVAEAQPDVRFCLAHCAVFAREHLERVHTMQNAWFDTSALKIQVQMVHEDSPLVPPASKRFDTDYSDYRRVMCDLAEAYPESIIWGTDSPAYSFICRRKQAEGSYAEFRLKGTYLEEKAALDALPADLRIRAGGANALQWLGVGG
jgi:predicted TIM-barrel fold metal-dependent hydrolase